MLRASGGVSKGGWMDESGKGGLRPPAIARLGESNNSEIHEG